MPCSISSGFTPINRQPTQLLTPQPSSTAPVQQNQARRRVTNVRRRHNSAVAQYLGIGSTNEPAHPEKYAPLSTVPESPCSKPTRKRRKLVGDNILPNCTGIDEENNGMPIQKLVSESFRETNPALQFAAVKLGASISAALQGLLTCGMDLQTSISDCNPPVSSRQDQSHGLVYEPAEKKEMPRSVHNVSEETKTASQFQGLQSSLLHTNEDNFDRQAHSDVDSTQDQFESSAFNDDDFGETISDNGFLMLTSDMGDLFSKSANPSSSSSAGSSIVLNLGRNNHSHKPDSFAQRPASSEQGNNTEPYQRVSKAFVSPVTMKNSTTGGEW